VAHVGEELALREGGALRRPTRLGLGAVQQRVADGQRRLPAMSASSSWSCFEKMRPGSSPMSTITPSSSPRYSSGSARAAMIPVCSTIARWANGDVR